MDDTLNSSCLVIPCPTTYLLQERRDLFHKLETIPFFLPNLSSYSHGEPYLINVTIVPSHLVLILFSVSERGWTGRKSSHSPR